MIVKPESDGNAQRMMRGTYSLRVHVSTSALSTSLLAPMHNPATAIFRILLCPLAERRGS